MSIEQAKKKWNLWDKVNHIFETNDNPETIKQQLFNLTKSSITNN